MEDSGEGSHTALGLEKVRHKRWSSNADAYTSISCLFLPLPGLWIRKKLFPMVNPFE